MYVCVSHYVVSICESFFVCFKPLIFLCSPDSLTMIQKVGTFSDSTPPNIFTLSFNIPYNITLCNLFKVYIIFVTQI